ncbi:recombinase family protein [Paenibacillus xylanexedens]|uniref:recombinase family protein n=1 Tax=Paenibacillus xylanexedens TaxID=528191 RepID=UPI0028CB5302|nr:recombinase family protein [Paenibacillus xylanexedens]
MTKGNINENSLSKSTNRYQSLISQMDALEKFGFDKIYYEKASGGKDDRPELERVLDTLVKVILSLYSNLTAWYVRH